MIVWLKFVKYHHCTDYATTPLWTLKAILYLRKYRKIKRRDQQDKINYTEEQTQIYTDIHPSPHYCSIQTFWYMYLDGSWNKSVFNLMWDFEATKYIENK